MVSGLWQPRPGGIIQTGMFWRRPQGGAAPTVTALTGISNPTNTSAGASHTHTSSLASAAYDRHIILLACLHGGSVTTWSSATIGGVSATNVVSVQGSGQNMVAALVIAAISSGTSGDVVVTGNASSARSAIMLFEAVGLTSATETASTSSGNDTTPNLSLNVSANGICVAGGAANNGTAGTFTGVTERFDATVSSLNYLGGSDAFASAQTPLAIDLTSTSNNSFAAVAAAWA